MAKEGLSIKLNMLWNSIGSMTYLGCQWLITILIVRLSSGFDAAGLLSLSMAVAGTFGVLANYKMGTYQVTDINHEHTIGEYLTFRIITTVSAFLLTVLYAIFTCELSAIVTISLYYIYKAVGLQIDSLHGLDQQYRRMDYIGISFILQGIISLVLFTLTFYFTQDLNITLIVMTVGVLFVLFLWDLPRSNSFEKIVLGISREKCFFFLRVSLPAVIASVAASAIFMIPKQYLSFQFSPVELGIYTSVASLALIIQMGAQYLYVPLIDIFAKHYSDGDKKGFVKLFSRTVFGILGVALVCAILLELFGPWLLDLMFGNNISQYTYMLQPVLLSTVLTAFLWFFGDLLIAFRDFRAYFLGNIVSFVSVIPFSVFFVNIWDMNGVSFAGIGSCLLGSLFLLAFIVYHLKKVKPKASSASEAE